MNGNSFKRKKLDNENMKDFRTKEKCLCFEVCDMHSKS